MLHYVFDITRPSRFSPKFTKLPAIVIQRTPTLNVLAELLCPTIVTVPEYVLKNPGAKFKSTRVSTPLVATICWPVQN